MIDIHSHILFGVDDGPKDLEESLILLRQAEEHGYRGIVCSSHYFIGIFENKNYDENFQILKERIRKEKINVDIYKGNEFALMEDSNLYIDKVHKINNGNYILVEIKGMILYKVCQKFFINLLKRGLIPVFAHVERYRYIKNHEFEELIKLGVVLQMNLNTAAKPGKKERELLEKRYIGILGTDTHGVRRRDYNLKEELITVEENLGKEYFKLLTQINPEKIINNEKIEFLKKGAEKDEKKNSRIRGIFSSLWDKLWKKFYSWRYFRKS